MRITMMKSLTSLFIPTLLACAVTGCQHYANTSASKDTPVLTQTGTPSYGTIEAVAEFPFRPGNVTATADGRVFATVHPLDGEHGVQLIEVTGPKTYKPWPSAEFQSPIGQFSDATIDAPLGITKDEKGGLWIIDTGAHLNKTRLWGFDIATGKLIQKIDIPTDIAPKGSFVQDLAVDRARGWAYLADISQPGIIAVNLTTKSARRFSSHDSFQPEKDAAMIINQKPIMFSGAPANVGINPITLSADRNTIFYGAMNGKSWYSLPAYLFRDNASDKSLGAAVKRVGDKPVSDGATTDAQGNHYFTNLNENGIDRLNTDGTLEAVVRDARFDWPDNAQFGEQDWLYVCVNQLHKTPAFTGKANEGKPPYMIYRVWVGR